MVTAIVRYELAPSLGTEQVKAYYNQATAKFEHLPGLIRKYFLLSEDGRFGGSVYLWETRDQAIAFHDEAWLEFMRGKYGHRPHVTIFDCPIVVDNLSGQVLRS